MSVQRKNRSALWKKYLSTKTSYTGQIFLWMSVDRVTHLRLLGELQSSEVALKPPDPGSNLNVLKKF